MQISDAKAKFSMSDPLCQCSLPLAEPGLSLPHPSGVQGQAGQPGPLEGVPARDKGWNKMGFKVFSKPNHSTIP